MSDSVAIRADHRLLKDIIDTMMSSAGVSPTPADLDLVAGVFKQAGGSWERVFRGSVKDVNLLKKALRTAIDEGRLTKTPRWGG
jgi:hypothetical protein